MEEKKVLLKKRGPRTYVFRRPNGTIDVGTLFDPENDEEAVSKTQEQHTDACNIEKIIARAAQGLPTPGLVKREGIFSDVSDLPSYQEALDYVKYMESEFLKIDPFIREKFNNDPDQMLKFMSDPKNEELAVEYGLLNKREIINENKSNENDNKNAKTKKASTSTASKTNPEENPQD